MHARPLGAAAAQAEILTVLPRLGSFGSGSEDEELSVFCVASLAFAAVDSVVSSPLLVSAGLVAEGGAGGAGGPGGDAGIELMAKMLLQDGLATQKCGNPDTYQGEASVDFRASAPPARDPNHRRLLSRISYHDIVDLLTVLIAAAVNPA
jgi:hypothetical protein